METGGGRIREVERGGGRIREVEREGGSGIERRKRVTISEVIQFHAHYPVHTHTHLLILHNCRQHDNCSTVSLIHHLPEITTSGVHRTLRQDKRLLLLVALEGGGKEGEVEGGRREGRGG